MKVIGVIPARYKSSRFEGKPLAQICGKPMIWWVWQQALKVCELNDLLIATDDERIAAVCEEYEMKFMMTSSCHKTGAERLAEVAKRTAGDLYINIQGDEPLLDAVEVDRLISLKRKYGDGYIGYRATLDSNSRIDDENTVKVVTDLEGYAMYFSRSAIPYTQAKDCVYRCMGLYAYDREIILKFAEWPQSKLEIAEKGIEMLRVMEHGIKVRLFDTEWHSIGVDLPEHIVKVEEEIKKRGL